MLKKKNKADTIKLFLENLNTEFLKFMNCIGAFGFA